MKKLPRSGISAARVSESPRAIDRLFERFEAYYGAAWLDQWVGQKQVEVRAVWEEELGEFTLLEIAAALKLLDSPHPVRLPEFRDLCKKARATAWRPPPGPLVIEDKRRVAPETIQSIKSILTGMKP